MRKRTMRRRAWTRAIVVWTSFLLVSITGFWTAAMGLDPLSAAGVSDPSTLSPKVEAPPSTILPLRLHSSKWLPAIEEPQDYRGASDRRFILIHQNRQMVYIFEDGQVIRQMPCSTGLPAPRTRTRPWSGRVGKYWGTFQAYGVWADNAWFLFKDDGSILIHSLPYTYVDGVKVYQDRDTLGKRPSSHGCIRISPEDAAWLTAWQPGGVLTLITPLTDLQSDG